MKRVSEDSSKRPNKRFRCAFFLDRVRAFFQWLPVGVTEIVAPPPEYSLPPTQAWSRTCPDHTLRCPGCGQYLEAPVKQCANGHSVCLKCRRFLSHCPVCRDHFIRTPQPILDRLLTTTRLPCLYAAYGCPVLEVLRRRESHSRQCPFRPGVCPLCTWVTPPRLLPTLLPPERGDAGSDAGAAKATGEQLLARHMTSAHRHHHLHLDKEYTLCAWLEPKKQTTAFLSCSMTADAQVFVFVMNYDTKRRKFFIVLKYIGSFEEKRNSAKSRGGTPSNCCEAGSKEPGSEEPPPLESDDPQEFSSHQNLKFGAEKEDSFERTAHEEIFRGQSDCEFCYLVELSDNNGIQAVRLAQTALYQEDALDLAVKSGRCLSVDFALLDRLLEPGNGQFTVKITISRIQSTPEDSPPKKDSETNVSESLSIT